MTIDMSLNVIGVCSRYRRFVQRRDRRFLTVRTGTWAERELGKGDAEAMDESAEARGPKV